jgi:hypothetical protein
MQPLLSPCCDHLFPLYLFSIEYPGDSSEISKDCYELKKTDSQGVVNSNSGGWQSRSHELMEGTDALKKLAAYVLHISNTTLLQVYGNYYSALNPSSVCDWWVNINKGIDYNEPHTHGDNKFIAVYYPKLCSLPGELCIHSPMSMSLNFGNLFRITPIENRIYFLPGPIIHSVAPSKTLEDDRISIAFNIN